MRHCEEMETIVRQTLLFDFYGELLTAHQQRIYEDVVCNDISCSEVAQQTGVSRQGVHDLIRRCNRQLEEYEDRLHLLEKFLSIKKEAQALRDVAQAALKEDRDVDAGITLRCCESILKEL